MRKIVLLFGLLYIAFCGTSRAQELEAPAFYRNSVYLELAGNAGVGSLNYERLIPFASARKTLALRIGGVVAPYGKLHARFGYEVLLPLEASVLFGKRAVKLELGLGATVYSNFNSYLDGAGSRVRYGNTDLLPVLRIGGRWQAPGKHWFVRVAATPFLKENFIGIDFPVSPWAGISVGYNFGRR